MNIFYIIAFLVGTGFGWCLCSLVSMLQGYFDMKRDRKKSEETWNSLRPYLEHCMEHSEGGIVWVSYDELRERRKKQNELYDKQTRRDSEETSSTS